MAMVGTRGNLQRLLEIGDRLRVFSVPVAQHRIDQGVVELIADIAGGVFGEGEASFEGVAIALGLGDEAEAEMLGDLGVDRRDVVAAVRIAGIEFVQPLDQPRLHVHAPEQLVDEKQRERAPENTDGGEQKLLLEILADIIGDAIAAGLIARFHCRKAHLQPAVELRRLVDVLVEITLDTFLGGNVLFHQPVEIKVAALAIIRAVARDVFVIIVLGVAEAAIRPINSGGREIRNAVDFGPDVEILDIGFLPGIELLRDDDIGGEQERPIVVRDVLIGLDITCLLLAKWQDVIAIGAIDRIDLAIPEEDNTSHPGLFSSNRRGPHGGGGKKSLTRFPRISRSKPGLGAKIPAPRACWRNANLYRADAGSFARKTWLWVGASTNPKVTRPSGHIVQFKIRCQKLADDARDRRTVLDHPPIFKYPSCFSNNKQFCGTLFSAKRRESRK